MAMLTLERARKTLLHLTKRPYLFKMQVNCHSLFATLKKCKWQLKNSEKAEVYTSAVFRIHLKTAAYFTELFFGAQILKMNFISGIQLTTM